MLCRPQTWTAVAVTVISTNRNNNSVWMLTYIHTQIYRRTLNNMWMCVKDTAVSLRIKVRCKSWMCVPYTCEWVRVSFTSGVFWPSIMYTMDSHKRRVNAPCWAKHTKSLWSTPTRQWLYIHTTFVSFVFIFIFIMYTHEDPLHLFTHNFVC